jgi:site-specific DNA recombinase
MEKKKAILYLRFSDTKQYGNTSIDSQEKICRNACEVESYSVVKIIKNEAVSASKTNTQRVAELLEFCKERKGKFDVLMVYKLDRFARSQEQHHWLRGQILKLGVILRSATEKIDESPSGRLVEGVLAAVNEYDNEVKRERVKIAMWSRVEHGLYPWSPPTGYIPKVVPGVKLSPRIIDNTCCNEIVSLFERYSTGLYTKADLAKEYSKKEIKNYKGKTLKFSIQTLDNILNNIFYTGYLKYKDGRLIVGKHKPLISYAMFEKCQEVQAQLSNNANHKYLRHNPDFPLRRFVLCGDCNGPLTACWSKSGSGKKHAYYYCKSKDCEMYSKMIKKADLENGFMEYLSKVKPTKKFVKRFNQRFLKRYKERELEIRGDFLRKADNIKEMEKELGWIVKQGRKGKLPERVVTKQVEELDQKIILAKSQLSEEHAEELNIKGLLSYAETFIRTLEKNWFDAQNEVRIRLQRVIFPDGVVYQNNQFSNAKLCRAFEIINDFATNYSKDVTPAGFEPAISRMRTWCPKPLDDGAVCG